MARHKLKPNASRNIRLADQIQKDLAQLIQRELDASLYGLITISGVDLSADYAHAKVYFTVMAGDPEVAGEALQEKASWFHGQLFKMLHIHTVPVLHFIHDQHVELGIAMTQLIDDAVRSDQKHHTQNEEPPADNSDQS